MCMNVSACVYVCASCVFLMPKEVRRRPQIPWNWSHGWLWAIMHVLGTRSRSIAKAASALDHWAVSLAFPSCFFDNLSSPWKLCLINVLLQWFGELWTLKSSEEHPSSVADATNPSSCVVLSAPHTCHQHSPDTARSSFSGVFPGQSLGGSEPSAVCGSMARKKDGACLRVDG